MKIYITDKNESRDILLKVWDNKANNGWSPDVFSDLADTLPIDFPAPSDVDAEAAMTEAEFSGVIAWWEDEIAHYNQRKRSWFTEALSDNEQDAEFARDLEYRLFVGV